MRTVISFAAACAVTLALFDFMFGLISRQVRDHEQPVQATAVQLITLSRATAAGVAGAGGGGQAQPVEPATMQSFSSPVRTDANETQASPSLPIPNQRIELPTPAIAPLDDPPVRGSPAVAVARQPILSPTKSQPGEAKTPTPPPTGKRAKASPTTKQSPAALPANPPVKPSAKSPATAPRVFPPRQTVDRESQAGAGAGPAQGNVATSGGGSVGSSSKQTGAGSGSGGKDTGASGNSPVGILSQTRPAYPRDALQRGQEGWVKVSFTITEQGRIENPAIVSSRPRQIFDQAALEAIVQWRFRPRMVNGKPVQTNAVQEIRFTLPR
jgi:protein TonB